ncbi:MAG: UDP-N-acetylmuramoyl-L-alanine--D-glutamate ligase [Clostridia bacterium]|nr:UDP-N-acetylmuramoyl-L-alanine--D-glutamate ligase [Clostridia bacterium]
MKVLGKRVLVVGLARSGIGAARLLAQRGALVTVNDSKSREALGEALQPLEGLKLTWALGRPAAEVLDGQELLVISPGIPDKAPFVVEAKNRGIPVIGELELGWALCPGETVAVTGTNGKTTTVSLLGMIFAEAGRGGATVGNIGYPFSEEALTATADETQVCECSSFQMETIERFRPRAAALLNITEDHLNRHGTMAEYTRLKMRMFENQTAQDYAIFNADDPALEGLEKQVRARVLFFSRKREVEAGACVSGGRVVFRLDGAEMDICAPEEIFIPGPHNLENALAAVCAAAAMGVEPDLIGRCLREFRGVEHRIEWTREKDGVIWYNDSKGTNVDSTIRAVQTMTRPTVIILGGSDKHADFTPLAEAMLASGMIREAVLIGVTADQIERTLREKGFNSIHREASMADAVKRCEKLSGEGWNVLLSPACASFDMFTDYEQRGRIFKELVQAL